jgi:photosystem II stability/assembly factor-like uncharacterized protein
MATIRTLSVFALAVLAAVRSAAGQSGTVPWKTGWPGGAGRATALAMSPADPSTLVAGAEGGLFETSDGGSTWTLLSRTVLSPAYLGFDPSTPSTIFAGSSDGFFRSLDGGLSLSLMLDEPVATAAFDPSNPVRLHVGGKIRVSRDIQNPVLRRSDDRGLTWTDEALTVLVDSIASLLIDPREPHRILAGADSYSGMGYPPDIGMVRSEDGGATWTALLSRFGDGGVGGVQALAFDSTAGAFYAGTSSGFVLRSTDDGTTWNRHQVPFGVAVASLAVDHAHPGTVYAGTEAGVYMSIDSGENWWPAGGSGAAVRALAIDPGGTVLHVAGSDGVSELALRQTAPSFPCRPDPATLCLLGGRFRVRAQARDPRTGEFATGEVALATEPFGTFSLPAFTGDATIPEILVKMVDASAAPWHHFRLFFGGLTDEAYFISVNDTLTGQVRTYQNDEANPFCGGGDTQAFPASESAPPASNEGAPVLVPSGNTLSLLSNRFQVSLSAVHPATGRPVTGAAIAGGDRFGYFSLPDVTGETELPEVCVKMIDGTAVSGSFWLFDSGMTNLSYTVTVVDTLTGQVQVYPSAGAFCGTADTIDFRSRPAPPPGTPDVSGRWRGFFDTSDDADCEEHVPVSLTVHLDGTRISSGLRLEGSSSFPTAF